MIDLRLHHRLKHQLPDEGGTSGDDVEMSRDTSDSQLLDTLAVEEKGDDVVSTSSFASPHVDTCTGVVV